MRWNPVLTVFLRKELRDLRRSPQVWAGYLILPVIAFALPVLFVAALSSGAVRTDPDLADLLRFAARDPRLALWPESQRVARLILREWGAFFLLMPVILSSMSAALAIAGEKQRRTLEPVLATPLSDLDFLLAKLLAVVTPAVAVTWLAAIGFVAAMAVTTLATIGVPLVPGWPYFAGIALLVPLTAIAAALVGMGVSIRAPDVHAAVQSAGL